MTWTRSAALRAGLPGAAGAAMILAILAPAVPSTGSATVTDAPEPPITLAAGGLAVPAALSAEDIAEVESAREQLAASRSQDRADAEEAAEKAAAEKAAAEKAAAEKAAAEKAAAEKAAAEKAEATVVGEQWTTVALNLRTQPNGSVITTMPVGTAVAVTNRTDGSWVVVQHNGQQGWVSTQYLADSKPTQQSAQQAAPSSTSGNQAQSGSTTQSRPSGGTCVHGSGIESGLGANARQVYRAVCSQWPQISGYGGYRPDGGTHGAGRAVDVMVSGQLGWDVANWARANAGALGISEVIYAQRIWTVQRGGEGWRAMSDRGSATANHYDHVHISTY